jgi:hypothetical protein
MKPNKLFYTELMIGGVQEYAVTLLAGDWSKYRRYASEADAKRCILDLSHIRHIGALAALEQFMRYGNGSWRVPLASVVQQGGYIVHHTNCLDGTVSIWLAILQGKRIVHAGSWLLCIRSNVYVEVVEDLNSYSSLNAFIRAHYTKVRPERKGGNGWKECKAFVDGHWMNLSTLRVTRSCPR